MSKDLNSFVVANPNKCIGCRACEVACSAVHSSNNNVVSTVGTVETPIIPRLFLIKTEKMVLPIQCRHCEDAPCANVCPVGAIVQQGDAIVVDEKACIGCKTCLLACPVGAIDLLPQYHEGQEVKQIALKEETADGVDEKVKCIAYKCDLCKSVDRDPACVAVCPKQALSVISPKQEKIARNKQAALSLLESIKNL